ncbi:unannotated protein [freshwater metagenome]|uniref:Unannotated protein n=1 Tax=freshwater metagenome TaxID=449393 RepID=A0A6J7DL46_9ZZZZ
MPRVGIPLHLVTLFASAFAVEAGDAGRRSRAVRGRTAGPAVFDSVPSDNEPSGELRELRLTRGIDARDSRWGRVALPTLRRCIRYGLPVGAPAGQPNLGLQHDSTEGPASFDVGVSLFRIF